jgi:EmrB/QacA subfamily drug resistance transporter
MPELTTRRQYLVLAICCMSLFIVGIDNTIVNVAIPAIRQDLGASVAGLQWVVDAYLVVVAGLLILGGATGDRLGRRRVFQTGLAVFVLGSVMCSLAPSLGWLIVARVVQGVGGSMLNPVAMAIVTNTFVDPARRARAIGLWGATFGASLALGPVVGGLLVGSIGWRAIFWINLPVGIGALILAQRFVPESRAERTRRVDPVGQGLVIAVLGTLAYALIEAPAAGWVSAQTLGCLAFVVAGLAAFVAWELRRTEPLIDPRFFRSVPFAGATVMAVCGFAAFGGFLFMNTLYLQEVLGYGAMKAGLMLLPMGLMIAVFSPISGRLVASRGPRLPLVVAGSLLAVSGLLLCRLSATTPLAQLLLAYVLMGVGFGLLNAPITNTAVSGMPRAQAGVAAAVATTSRQFGQALGVAVIGSVVMSGVHGPLHTALPAASRAGWWIAAACGLVVVALGMLTTGTRARQTAARTAARLAPEEVRTPAVALTRS